MSAKQWCFEPHDTWFFRESRPLSAIGGLELESRFPPPARTVMGAIRSVIGQRQGVDWANYLTDVKYKHILDEIGGPEDFGNLRLTGPYLIYENQRLYPVPQSLMTKNEHFQYLQIGGSPVHCDLGEKVQLPKLIEPGAKHLENHWLKENGLQKVLAGELPNQKDVIPQSDLFKNETRIGIVHNKNKRTIEEGLVYQTQHLRPIEKIVKIGAIVDGIADNLQPPMRTQERFGGEGRLATVTVTKAPQVPTRFDVPTDGQNLLLMLLTHADLGSDKDSWLPLPDFQKTTDKKSGNTVWQGILNGVELAIISAVLGKAVREGGWNLRKRCPRPMISLVPAGSVWFCQVKDNLSSAIKQLHGFKIGKDTALGRGELVAGVWK